jgi:hypothetical protein
MITQQGYKPLRWERYQPHLIALNSQVITLITPKKREFAVNFYTCYTDKICGKQYPAPKGKQQNSTSSCISIFKIKKKKNEQTVRQLRFEGMTNKIAGS